MSLLSAIKFVPKGERKVDVLDRKKEEKKRHKDKKSKKRKHRKDDRDSPDKSDQESDVSSVDSYDQRKKKKEDKDQDWRKELAQDDNIHEYTFQDFLDQEKEEKKTHQRRVPSPPPPVEAKTATNKNIADILRSRLKATPKALDPTEVEEVIRSQHFHQQSSSSLDNPENGANALESLKYSKDYMLLKNQYQKLQKSEKNPQKDNNHNSKKDNQFNRGGGEEENIDKIYSQNILRLKGKYKGSELLSGSRRDGSGAQEEDELDMSLFTKKANSNKKVDGSTKSKQEMVEESTSQMKQQIQDSMKEQKKMISVLNNCFSCVSHAKFPRHLIVGASENTVLRLKSHQYSLTNGHFELLPRYHSSSFLSCEEETQKELLRTISSIQRMYERVLNKNTVVMETAIRLNQKPHCLLEIVPVEKGMESDVQMFFREVSNMTFFLLIIVGFLMFL
jgi:diadenosine tetraphosphate (Ap4A) HIT family hydrolase